MIGNLFNEHQIRPDRFLNTGEELLENRIQPQGVIPYMGVSSTGQMPKAVDNCP